MEVMSIVNDNAIGTFLTEKWENEEILGNQRLEGCVKGDSFR